MRAIEKGARDLTELLFEKYKGDYPCELLTNAQLGFELLKLTDDLSERCREYSVIKETSCRLLLLKNNTISLKDVGTKVKRLDSWTEGVITNVNFQHVFVDGVPMLKEELTFFKE